MRGPGGWSAPALLVLASALVPTLSPATDTNGGNDCVDRGRVERGDAPEGIPAYPGVLAAFPSCTSPGPVGTQNIACPPISSPPGPAGFVAHVAVPGEDRYWLGCFAGLGGLDEEGDAKVNANGGPASDCSNVVTVDCVETAFGLSFGQDECYGSSDAALASAIAFTACAPSTVSFPVSYCGTTPRTVYLNILVDWNQDGDWNDNFQCGTNCVFEWAVQNVAVTLAPGCTTLTSPSFQAGPTAGNGWMRLTVSNDPVPLDFPWAGSATTPDQTLYNGETEDYPIGITSGPIGGHCPDYEDWGDAPETSAAYSNAQAGAFPTCSALGPIGTVNAVVPPLGTPPLEAGYVRHVGKDPDPKFWLGCGDPAFGTEGIDSETNGKMNANGSALSDCDPLLAVDGTQSVFSLTFGQDETIGDPPGDAGLIGPVSFQACAMESVTFLAYNCDPAEAVLAYLNVLVDMNEDADWNDNFACGPQPGGPVAHEWCVKNRQVQLPPGCTTMSSGTFRMGPNGGEGWMRLTLSLAPVGDDFPWNGSAGAGGGLLVSGETEDYPVTIVGPDTCQVAYEDLGDAPEDLVAYTTGVVGRFPTCLAPGAAGDRSVACGTAQGTPPGATGHVLHVAAAADPQHFWLGCAQATSALLAVDGEADGKVNVGGPWGGASVCAPAVGTDCIESLIGLGMNQDECVGDADAALAAPTFFYACSTGTVSFSAFNCASGDVAAYLNVLVDWSHDGDWNDTVHACGVSGCAPEWAIKNLQLVLAPGCQTYATPAFPTGGMLDRSWMRLTLSSVPAPDDFPWNGTAGMSGGHFVGGETEDHPINVVANPVAVEDGALAGRPWLGTPFPNPARGRVGIPFTLASGGDVLLAVYDLAGRRLATLHEGEASAGPHQVAWDLRDASGRALPPGHYVVRLRAGGRVLSRVLVRLD